MSRRLLLQQFARVPRVGGVKTRLIPALGAEGACALHAELLWWTLRQLRGSELGEVELWLDRQAPADLERHCREAGVDRLCRQAGADLGERMWDALRRGLVRGEAVILVGSDCPWLGPAALRSARAALERAPVVLQPALDGGYVLIATRVAPARDWFEGIAWGGDRVYADTLERLRRSGVAWEALQPLPDIDRPEDLPRWRALRDAPAAVRP